MAQGGATVTGLREAQAAVERLPETIAAALKGVAGATAERIRAGYVQRLLSQTHRTGRTAHSARVLDESAEKQFVVNVPGHADEPAHLPNWLEYGTRFMVARPSLRPACMLIWSANRSELDPFHLPVCQLGSALVSLRRNDKVPIPSNVAELADRTTSSRLGYPASTLLRLSFLFTSLIIMAFRPWHRAIVGQEDSLERQ